MGNTAAFPELDHPPENIDKKTIASMEFSMGYSSAEESRYNTDLPDNIAIKKSKQRLRTKNEDVVHLRDDTILSDPSSITSVTFSLGHQLPPSDKPSMQQQQQQQLTKAEKPQNLVDGMKSKEPKLQRSLYQQTSSKKISTSIKSTVTTAGNKSKTTTSVDKLKMGQESKETLIEEKLHQMPSLTTTTCSSSSTQSGSTSRQSSLTTKDDSFSQISFIPSDYLSSDRGMNVNFLVDQSTCQQQLQLISLQMEAYKTDTQKVLEEKDNIILCNQAEIEFLKNELLQVKLKAKEEQFTAKTETRSLIQKMTHLQHEIKDAKNEKISAASAEITSSSSKSVSSESHEQFQELLNKLANSETDHQKERAKMQQQLTILRDSLSRLERSHTTVQNERDVACRQYSQLQQQCKIEKTLHKSFEKYYQAEIQKLKQLYHETFQDTRKKAARKALQTKAVTVGSRMGARILQDFIQNDQEDDFNDQYSYPSPEAEAAAVSTAIADCKQQRQRQEQLQTLESVPTYIPKPANDKDDNESKAFEESIAITDFLKEVW